MWWWRCVERARVRGGCSSQASGIEGGLSLRDMRELVHLLLLGSSKCLRGSGDESVSMAGAARVLQVQPFAIDYLMPVGVRQVPMKGAATNEQVVFEGWTDVSGQQGPTMRDASPCTLAAPASALTTIVPKPLEPRFEQR